MMEKIAIIGLSCLFPDAQTPDQFWQNLLAGKRSTAFATDAEMGVDPDIFFDPNKSRTTETGKYYCKQGGYVRDFVFDPTGYRVAPEILSQLDELYQWTLYVSKQALSDGGYLSNSAALAKCGILLGTLSIPTKLSHELVMPIYQKAMDIAAQELLQTSDFSLEAVTANAGLPWVNGCVTGYPSALIAQALSLSRVHFSLDAACASSLYAIKLACQFLSARKADLMLATAVSGSDPYLDHMAFSVFQAYPENGSSCPLDENSGGMLTAKGAGAVLLKRYEDAVRDGDRIHAVISGVGLSNDGKGKHFLSPNPKGQILAFERAYADAGIDPQEIDYVECHATGTFLGDRTELNSMESFWGKGERTPKVGSVKSNLGHLLTAAGMPSLMKVILSMQHGQLPPTIGVKTPLGSANHAILPEQVVTQTTPWTSSIKRAGVNAFGFGGCNSHLVLEQAGASELASQPLQPANRLAIVGMEAVFGSCKNLAEFERCIYRGEQKFIEVPKERWSGMDTQPKLLNDFGFAESAPQGAYIQDFDIDYFQFKIPPDENDQPIAQQLLMLKVADGALKDAKMQPGGNVAVIVAMASELSIHLVRGRCDLLWQVKDTLASAGIDLPPEKILELEHTIGEGLRHVGGTNQVLSFIGNIMPSRVATQWDFTGPAFTLSSEENSVFKALEVAQLLLSDPKLDAVVVGAIDLAGGVERVVLNQQISVVNTGTPTLGYDQHSNGWMIGEGAGAVVLKRVEDARQNCDRIYAVVDAVSFVQGEVSETLSRQPDANAITQTCQQALEQLGLTPDQIGYLEVFGSGIECEDTAELTGLAQAYRTGSSDLSCAIGSIKANIGHCFAASGMASLIKTALCLHYQYLPATPNWTAPKHPELWEDTPFYVPRQSRTWHLPRSIDHRVAAINGISLDRTYAHIILSEEPIQRDDSTDFLKQSPFYLFPIAANDLQDLLAQLEMLKAALSTSSLPTLATQTFNQFREQNHLPYAIAIVGGTISVIEKEIDRAIAGIPQAFAKQEDWKTPLGSYLTPNPLGTKGGIAFVYPGAFTSYIGMAPDIYRLFPKTLDLLAEFTHTPYLRNLMRDADAKLYPKSRQKLSNRQLEKLEQKLLDDLLTMLISGMTSASGFTSVLRDCFKVKPQAAFGYSLGEYSMMFAHQVWKDAESAIEKLTSLPLLKSRIVGAKTVVREFWGLPPTEDPASDELWGIYIVMTSAQEMQEAIKGEERVYLTQINTPMEVVIAGEPAACLRVLNRLQCSYLQAPFNNVIHCDPVKSEHQTLVDCFLQPLNHLPDVKLYSTADYQPIPMVTGQVAQRLANMICQPVDFTRLIHQVYADGARIFVELGPGGTCTRWIKETLKDQAHDAIAFNTRGIEDHVSIVRVLARLVSHRTAMDLSPLYDQSLVLPRKKGLIRTVTLGGHDLVASILTEDNRALFPPELVQRKPAQILPKRKKLAIRPYTVSRIEPKQVSRERTIIPASISSQSLEQLFYSQSVPLHRQRAATLTMNESALVGVQSHAQVLRSRFDELHQLSQQIQHQIALSKELGDSSGSYFPPPPLISPPPPPYVLPPKERRKKALYDEADLLEHATGKVANVFGEAYAEIDTYPHRIRVPMPPYLFISRVLKLEAKRGCLEPCYIEAEYDIPEDAWYALDGNIPAAIAIEACHSVMFMASYLGIDFEMKGERLYRALSGTATFTDRLPKAGQTFRTELQINSFVRNGDTLVYFFVCNYFVGDRHFLELKSSAGFFTPEELRNVPGATRTKIDEKIRSQIQKRSFEPLLPCSKTAFSVEDLRQLSAGNLAACFGSAYQQNGLNPSIRFASPSIAMFDRVVSIDPKGGAWGLGLVVAEKEIDPEHWYLNCHFKDDYCLPGTLTCEGKIQLICFYMMYLGLQTRTKDAEFVLMTGLTQAGTNKGQVTPLKSKITFYLEVTDIGLEPEPYVIGEASAMFEGKTISIYKNLGIKLTEKS